MVTPSPGAARLVFVSHSGEDTWVARQVARCIADCGAKPFLDQADIAVGADFEEDIREFLDQADELVVLFTPWSLERPYVWVEIGAAWIRRPSLSCCWAFRRLSFKYGPMRLCS